MGTEIFSINTSGIKSIDSFDLNGTDLILNFTDSNGSPASITHSLFGFGDSQIKYNVENYSELLSVTDPGNNEFAYVRNKQGTSWLPGNVGGNYYGSGLYMWNGTNWVEDDTELFNEINTIVNDLNNEIQNRISADALLQQQIDNLNHSNISNQTFEQFIKYVKGLDSNPDFTYSNGLLSQITYNWNSNQTFLTLNYNQNDVLISLVLSGEVNQNINTTKTLNYDLNNNLSSITYS